MTNHTSFKDILDSVRQGNIQRLICRAELSHQLAQCHGGPLRSAATLYSIRNRALRQLARIQHGQVNGIAASGQNLNGGAAFPVAAAPQVVDIKSVADEKWLQAPNGLNGSSGRNAAKKCQNVPVGVVSTK